MNNLVPVIQTNAEIYRASTDAAGLCRDIVLKTAMNIGGRKYVKAEGWQAIAIAHGCVASAENVHRVEDEGMAGYAATGTIRRMADGAEIARAEGFVGDDEPMWAKRPVYARRAMAQTRAVSRACRSAFAHVVVLIDSNLSTTPAEEVPDGGFEERPMTNVTPPSRPPKEPAASAPKPGNAPTLGEWADKLVVALKGAATPEEAKRTYESASRLCADLDLKLPERLVEINTLYETILAGAPKGRPLPDGTPFDDEIPF